MIALIEGYLAVRRAAGFKMDRSAWNLGLFAKFATARGDTHVRTETTIAWAATARSPRASDTRMRDLILVAEHMRAEDAGHEQPPRGVFAFHARPRLPHIYTDDEVRLVLAELGRLRPGSCCGPSFQTLFALLAVTGMRVGEGLRLDIRDVTAEGILVRETKFRKTRFLPVHRSTHAALDAYRERWRPLAKADEPFFVSTLGTRMRYRTVHTVFVRALRRIGLRNPELGTFGPRVHDLRHAFAVRSLEACPEGQRAINRHVLALTTYMGHVNVAATSWYLHATPRLMTDIADACEALADGGAR